MSAAENGRSRWERFRLRVFEIISKADEGDLASFLFDGFIMALIALSVASIILESYASLAAAHRAAFRFFEVFTAAVFTVEYILRVWTADILLPGRKHPRLRYVVSFMAIIDLLAILPFFVPFIPLDLRFLRMVRLLRLFRLFRVLKLGRYFDALTVVLEVIRKSLSQLFISMVLCFLVILFAAIVMYAAENLVQPDVFPNIGGSLWWAVSTLTTVGYGDVYPITPVGRILASLISLVGIGIIAIPTGIIAAGFSAVIRERSSEKEDAAGDEKLYCPYCGRRLDEHRK